ncbi:hypothetical protein VNO78_01565 [Psophocarpus tetragonolobus]|uniref:RNase H type-1 domain-containing protein n=1 Tax=Psophocarpus tetragonolobus TaxID=3891 RepID=A0AAN9XUQ1_PSOTE
MIGSDTTRVTRHNHPYLNLKEKLKVKGESKTRTKSQKGILICISLEAQRVATEKTQEGSSDRPLDQLGMDNPRIEHEESKVEDTSQVDRGSHMVLMPLGAHATKGFWTSLGFKELMILEATSHSGGIWVLCQAQHDLTFRIVKVKKALKTGFSFMIGQGNTLVWFQGWSGWGNICEVVSFEGFPTNDKCFHYNVNSSLACTRCSTLEEHPLHCLRDCPHSLNIWMRLGFGEEEFYLLTILEDWLKRNLLGTHGTLFVVTLWWIRRCIDISHDGFLRFLVPQGHSDPEAVRRPRWIPPPFLGLIKVASSQPTCAWALEAFFMGLTVFGWRVSLVLLIPLEVIQYLNYGTSATNGPYLDVATNIKELVQRNCRIQLCHIPREANKLVDALAKAGLRKDIPLVLL